MTLSRRSKRVFNLPQCLPGIERTTSLKILGVTITDKLSMSDHVRDVILKCAQSLHVVSVLRRHCMNDHALQAVYTQIVVLAKLHYALGITVKLGIICSVFAGNDSWGCVLKNLTGATSAPLGNFLCATTHITPL